MRKELWIRSSERSNTMIEKIDANQIPDILEKSPSKQPDSAKTPPNNGVDASLQVNYASLIEKANQTSYTTGHPSYQHLAVFIAAGTNHMFGGLKIVLD